MDKLSEWEQQLVDYLKEHHFDSQTDNNGQVVIYTGLYEIPDPSGDGTILTTVAPDLDQPVPWNDGAAWDIDWDRGMYCIERGAGCQEVFHSVEDEVKHMDTVHPESSAGIRLWEFSQ